MALLLNNAIFYHVPKTGGAWVRYILAKTGLAQRELLCNQCAENGGLVPSACCQHVTYRYAALPADGKKRFVFMFVRHPLTYYQSYWAFRMQWGWDMTSEFDRRCAHDDFQTFIRAVLSDRPWSLTQMYEDFVGPEEAPIADFVGKQETLRLDLLRVLRRLGRDVDADFLMQSALPMNEESARSAWKDRCRYTPELREAICEAESGAMTRFGYW